MLGSHWRRSLLRRQLGALGAAPLLKTARDQDWTRSCASQSATAGNARAAGGDGEAAIPRSKARAPAVATFIVLATVCCMSPARADDVPPPTTPATTTPDAPPPDPYHPPAPTRAPKPAPVHSAPAVHSVRVVPAPTRAYSRPSPRPAVGVQRTPVHRARKKVTRKPRVHAVHRAPAPKPKPVTVTFKPFANLVATSRLSSASTVGGDDRQQHYLRLAGLAFALLAAAALSLHVLSVRMIL